MNNKIRVAVLYGGRSGEHEVSLQSAASVIRNLDPERFEIIPIGIDKSGRWGYNDLALMQGDAIYALPIYQDSPSVVLPPYASDTGEVAFVGDADTGRIDVIFPVVHGPLCEDGSIQGLCELADIPYVGAGVLGSAVAMDKDIAKRLVTAAGIAVAPYIALRRERWDPNNSQEFNDFVDSELGYPVFIKPANQGSSVGIHKVHGPGELDAALTDAFRYDLKVLVEQGIDAREIEIAVLENPDGSGEPLASIPGEVMPMHEFYSYEAKYLDEKGAVLMIPAELDEETAVTAREMAQEIFLALECEGMARIDLFLDRVSGELFFNEANTIPGFTTISMYPKLWEASGLSYRDLLSTLIDLAMSRHQRRSRLLREFKKGEEGELQHDAPTTSTGQEKNAGR